MRQSSLTSLLSLVLVLLSAGQGRAQQTLTLEDCRQMALRSDMELRQAQTRTEMARYDRQIARANYFPNISATGTYQYNSRDLDLVGDDMSERLENLGTTLHTQTSGMLQQLTQAITANPQAAMEFMQSPLWQTVIGTLSQTDLSTALNQIGSQVDQAFHLDITNVFAGAVSLQQPVFMGGKIIEANRVARLAETLARTQYEQQEQEVILSVDQAYWQIVSIANKLALAEEYADLLHSLERDVNISVQEGVSTPSDALQIQVKANEADMLRTKARNGLTLSKMLLCKKIGLPLDSDILLEDERRETLPLPVEPAPKDPEDIYSDRPETRSLQLAAQIYDGKARIARADMLPKVALTANYLVTNPSAFNGFQNEFGGMFNAGVVVNVPLFHGFEAAAKTRKARAEATLYRTRYEDAKEMIDLQVTQLRQQRSEAAERRQMTLDNLQSAQENLRVARTGFDAGVTTTNTVLAAHAAWLQAQSERIDSEIELLMNDTALRKAEGDLLTHPSEQ